MDTNFAQERSTRWRRAGMVDALMDCLALLARNEMRPRGLRHALQQWHAEAAGPGSHPGPSVNPSAHPGSSPALTSAQPAAATHDQQRREGMLDGYRACHQWLEQGLDGKALAARILQRIFAVWPHGLADYHQRYDAFLEKALENPRAAYYPNSREWMDAVDDLHDKVARNEELRQTPSDKLVQRTVELLHTRQHPQPAALAGERLSIPQDARIP